MKHKIKKRLMAQRNLINLNGSLAIVLPKQYVNRFRLKPKDEMVIVVDDAIVHIMPTLDVELRRIYEESSRTNH